MGNGFQECVQTTHGQNQKGVGSRVGSGDVWGGGLGWEENGDNCTWTTIKKSIKKKRIEIVVSVVQEPKV